MAISSLTLSAWLLLGFGALFVGFSKTAIAGGGMVAVGIYAAVLPARASTGTLLLLLMIGDLSAIAAYRCHADWRILRRLAPAVLVGIVIGAVFVAKINDISLKRSIGGVLLFLVGVHIWSRRRAAIRAEASPSNASGLVTQVAGITAGFTSMVANAGGAVTTIFMLREGLSTLAFLGTGSWLYFLVNIAKLPFSIGLGLTTGQSVVIALIMAPLILLGGWIGRRVIAKLNRRQFEVLVLAFTVISAINLLR